MHATDSRLVLWRNVCALMHKKYGRENLSRLSAEAGLSTATISRIKDGETSIGVTVIDAIANAMEVPAMQLLNPDFDPNKRVMPVENEFSPLACDLAVQLDSVQDPLKRERAYILASQALVSVLGSRVERSLSSMK